MFSLTKLTTRLIKQSTITKCSQIAQQQQQQCQQLNQKLNKSFSYFKYENNQENKNQYRGRYTPLMPLQFINDKCKIYEYTIYNSVSKGYYIILGLSGLLVLHFMNKLIDFKERRWYGLIFYSAGFIFLAPKVYQFAKIYSQIIHQINLSKSGTEIYVKHAKYGLIPTESKFDIANIAKPMDPDVAIQIFRFAYPVAIEDKLFYLPRDTDFQNNEVLPPIMNGIYINTDVNNQYPEEIIID